MLPRIVVNLTLLLLTQIFPVSIFAAEETEKPPNLSDETLTLKRLTLEDGSRYGSNGDQGFSKWTEESSIAWSKNIGRVYSKPLLGVNEDIFLSSSNGRLYCITLTGEVVWQFKTQGPFYHSPVLGNQNNVLYAATQNGWLYALNARDGTELWQLNLHFSQDVQLRSSPTLAPVAADDNTLYLTSNNTLYAVDISTHKMKWSRIVGESN